MAEKIRRRGFLGLIGAAAAAPLVAVAARPEEAFPPPEQVVKHGWIGIEHVMLRLNPEAELGSTQRYCRVVVATYPNRHARPRVETVIQFAECKMHCPLRDDPEHEIIVGTRAVERDELTAYERQLADLAPSLSNLITAVIAGDRLGQLDAGMRAQERHLRA